MECVHFGNSNSYKYEALDKFYMMVNECDKSICTLNMIC